MTRVSTNSHEYLSLFFPYCTIILYVPDMHIYNSYEIHFDIL
jgi:hypothetical protein